MKEVPEVKGFVIKKKSMIQQPKFEDKHIRFISKYLDAEIMVNKNTTMIKPVKSKEQIQMAIRAYVYEFGEW